LVVAALVTNDAVDQNTIAPCAGAGATMKFVPVPADGDPFVPAPRMVTVIASPWTLEARLVHRDFGIVHFVAPV
jgi:hypothetical protein